VKAGIFIGPEIHRLIKNSDFKNHLNHLELPAWESFVKIVKNFLGYLRDDTYQELVDNLLSTYHNMGSRMSLKLHFLHSYLDFFPSDLGAVRTSMVSAFTKKFRWWRHDIKVVSIRVWWEITVGSSNKTLVMFINERANRPSTFKVVPQ